jgi:hypothetical protein
VQQTDRRDLIVKPGKGGCQVLPQSRHVVPCAYNSKLAASGLQFYNRRVPIPDERHVVRPTKLADTSLRRSRIVVACYVNDRDAFRAESRDLLEQESLGIQAQMFVVQEVACDEQRVDPQADGVVDDCAEGVPHGYSERLANLIGFARKTRVKMDVGYVEEPDHAEWKPEKRI